MPNKITISPGQALLLLIEHHRGDKGTVERLEKLYLSGIQSRRDLDRLKTLFTDQCLAAYNVSYEMAVINNDPARRYFETQLAYSTLKHGLAKIDESALKKHVDTLIKIVRPSDMGFVIRVLHGEVGGQAPDIETTYSNYISKIKKGEIFHTFPLEDKKKLTLFAQMAYLGVVVSRKMADLPLDIYGKGIYSIKSRGKTLLGTEQYSARNQHYGLMKGHMPLSQDDEVYSQSPIPHLKACEQSTYEKSASWVKANFNRLVHPYSNSISGVVLCQMKMLALFRNEGLVVFTASAEKMSQFFRLMTSTILFYHGGHTIYEFTAPFSVKAVQDEFEAIPEFNTINMETMYDVVKQINTPS